MKNSGLNYLLRFSKIQKNEKVGDIEAIDFKTIENGTQMGHLIITCKCDKYKKQFNIAASILNWKITKFIKGTSKSLDYATIFQARAGARSAHESLKTERNSRSNSLNQSDYQTASQ